MTRPADLVAIQQIFQGAQNPVERCLDEAFELGFRSPHLGLRDDGSSTTRFGDSLGGQPLLGAPAFVAKPGQRANGGGGGGVDVGRPAGVGQDRGEQRPGRSDHRRTRGRRTVSPIGWNARSASARVRLVPLPPKSSRATDPVAGQPRIGLQGGQRASPPRRPGADGTPLGASLRSRRNAVLSAPVTAGPQCAGTAITMSAVRLGAVRGRPSPQGVDQEAVGLKGVEPSTATRGRDRRRVRRSRAARPVGVLRGHAHFRRGSPNRVSTARRITG